MTHGGEECRFRPVGGFRRDSVFAAPLAKARDVAQLQSQQPDENREHHGQSADGPGHLAVIAFYLLALGDLEVVLPGIGLDNQFFRVDLDQADT